MSLPPTILMKGGAILGEIVVHGVLLIFRRARLTEFVLIIYERLFSTVYTGPFVHYNPAFSIS